VAKSVAAYSSKRELSGRLGDIRPN